MADKRKPSEILVATRRFADEHDACLRIAVGNTSWVAVTRNAQPWKRCMMARNSSRLAALLAASRAAIAAVSGESVRLGPGAGIALVAAGADALGSGSLARGADGAGSGVTAAVRGAAPAAKVAADASGPKWLIGCSTRTPSTPASR